MNTLKDFSLFNPRVFGLLFAIALQLVFADSFSGITGPATANQYSTVQYSYTQGTIIANPTWTVSGGTFSTWSVGTVYYINITWTSTGTQTVSFYDFMTLLDSKNVTVSASAPPAPVAIAPTSVTATSFAAQWNTTLGATSYRLDVSSASDFSSFVSGYNNLTVSGLSQSVTGLTQGVTYYYRVRAVNATGTSSNSNTITADLLPLTPTANAASGSTISSFSANWSAVSGASSYRLDVSTVSNFASFVSGYNNLTVAGLTQSVTGLAAGSTYYYRVRAVNSAGTSSNSSTITAMTITVAPTAQPATSPTSNSFLANWTAVSGATSYKLDVSTSTTFSSFLSGYNDLTVAGTSQSVTGLTQKTAYYYRVRAVNAGGPSANSNVIVGINLDYNYVRSVDVLKGGLTTDAQVDAASPTGEKVMKSDFFDGLGRPIQSISMNQSPSQLDIIQPMVYDAMGREAVKYLPYAIGSDGWIKLDFAAKELGGYTTSPQYLFYQNTAKVAVDTKPYAETVFEASPLNRPVKQGAPGLSWQPDGTNTYNSTDHTVKKAYEVNGANEVLKWTYTYPNASFPFGKLEASTGTTPVYYAAGELVRNRTRDEHQNEVIEYVDVEGHTVLKRVQYVSGSVPLDHDNYASTYYIYDDFGSLVYVVPPEASKKLSTEYYQSGATDNTKYDFLGRWAFRYKYDTRRRMILKQVPGADSVRMVYDDRDRLILTQDGNQRSGSTKYWTFTKYDELNRPVMTGIRDTSVSLTQVQMQAVVNAHFAKASAKWFETYVGSAGGNVHGYTNKAYPVRTGSTAGEVNADKYLTVTYYDNYSFRSLWTGTWTYLNESLSEAGGGVTYNQPSAEFTYVNSKPTGTKVKVLDGGATGMHTWLKSVTYYDDKYRVIQTLSDNYKGGTDRVTNVVDFTGKVLESKLTHVEQDITWKDVVGGVVIGNKLDRTVTGSNWTACGAVSTTQLAASTNGWLEVTVAEVAANKMIGLADTNPDVNYTSIDYCFYMNGAVLKVYENGTLKSTVSGGIAVGDVIRIERNGTTITYKKNGNVVYTSATASSTILFADASVYAQNTTLTGVRASFASTTRTVSRRFTFDHASRLLTVKHQLDAQGEVTLISNQYNELGQLVDKKLHSTDGTTYKQSADYRYNIRGWLTSMNNSKLEVNSATNDDTNDLFGMELTYDQVDAGISNAQMFNGNISGVKWSNYPGSGNLKEKGYIYTYDPLNRITGSTFKEKTTSWTALTGSAFAETGFQYDMNGNIKNLTRNDKRGSGTMDILTYDYGTTTSNQLKKVTDAGDDFTGFIDGTNSGDDYTYDANGNMITDQNKGIATAIVYNHLNLPELITKGANTVRYIYDASGRKLSQTTIFGGTPKQTDYSGEFIYESDALQFANHEEGRIVTATTSLVYTNRADAATDFTAVTSTLATVTQNGTEKYVKATSVGTTARQGMFPIGGTFSVTAGEQYKIRVKGYRTGTSPVYIVVKAGGADIIWPGASLADGSGTVGFNAEAWSEQVVTIPTGATTLQAGVTWNTVTAGQIFYVNEIEITKLSTGTPEYQYTLKDHLGNTRLTFTSNPTTDQNTATLEDANLNVEQSKFLRITNAKRVNAAIFDKTNGAATGYSERLNGSTNEKYGVARSISVMPGDVINAEVYGKYVDQNSSNWNGALTTLMGQIAANQAGVVYDGANYSSSTSSFPFAGLINTTGSSGGPKAYLNWLIFDRNYTFLNGGYVRMSATPKEQGQDVAHELMSSGNITITEPGYVYIYLSNEETSPVEVYFDDMKVTQTNSPVVQVEDYYPFGLTFNEYQRENGLTNPYQYNGKEMQDELNIGILDFSARLYDPTLAQALSIDPHSLHYPSRGPYTWVLANPIRFVDIDGRDPREGNEVIKIDFNKSFIVGLYGYEKDTFTRMDRELYKNATQYHIENTLLGPGLVKAPQWLMKAYDAYDKYDTFSSLLDGSLTKMDNAYSWQSASMAKKGYSFLTIDGEHQFTIRHVLNLNEKLGKKGFENTVTSKESYKTDETGKIKISSYTVYKYVNATQNGKSVVLVQKMTYNFEGGKVTMKPSASVVAEPEKKKK